MSLLHPPSDDDIERLLLDELPSHPDVISFEVATVLRTYRSGYDWNAGRLPPDVVEILTEDVRMKTDDSGLDLEELVRDEASIIHLLAQNGRATLASLAQATNSTPGTVRRRLEALFDSGVLHVRTEVEPGMFGLHIEEMVWLRVPSGQTDEICARLSENPAVRYCSASTGKAPIFLDVLSSGLGDLLDYHEREVGALPGAEILESRIVLLPVKRGPRAMMDLSTYPVAIASSSIPSVNGQRPTV